ncbi:hypothetical protein V7148_19655 [Gottfriedia acidiceleris]|uniref:hypothetical protein n=1 Tax=Bacillaceae TaxID=186817 RepID=UPI0015965740|nr:MULTISPECIES: hypothetical protein [unclassified Bacillus (in: firmicutes)]
MLQKTIPPINSLIRDGYGFGTDDEKTYDERRMKYLNRFSVSSLLSGGIMGEIVPSM